MLKTRDIRIAMATFYLIFPANRLYLSCKCIVHVKCFDRKGIPMTTTKEGKGEETLEMPTVLLVPHPRMNVSK